MRRADFEQLVLTARTELERQHGERAIMAEERPTMPTSGPHLSWMLARALQLFDSGKELAANRWLGHVEGVVSLLKERADAETLAAMSTPGPALTEQEQRVWAATLGTALAAKGSLQEALSLAYESVWLLRGTSVAQGYDVGTSFPPGWEPPER